MFDRRAYGSWVFAFGIFLVFVLCLARGLRNSSLEYKKIKLIEQIKTSVFTLGHDFADIELNLAAPYMKQVCRGGDDSMCERLGELRYRVAKAHDPRNPNSHGEPLAWLLREISDKYALALFRVRFPNESALPFARVHEEARKNQEWEWCGQIEKKILELNRLDFRVARSKDNVELDGVKQKLEKLCKEIQQSLKAGPPPSKQIPNPLLEPFIQRKETVQI